jgi:flotillin
VRSSENLLQEVTAQITAQTRVATADADKRLTDAVTRRDAVIAEEMAAVAALIAKAEAEIKVQTERIEQTRRQLEADVIAPARAECESMEQKAQADVAPIIEDGRARAAALTQLAESWAQAGDQAREIFLLQKLESIVKQLTATIAETEVERLTVIDGQGAGTDATKLLALNEQVKEVFGIDLAEKVRGMGKDRTIVVQAPSQPEGAS